MPHAYTEDQLVEQPAIGLFAELGWHTVVALLNTTGRMTCFCPVCYRGRSISYAADATTH